MSKQIAKIKACRGESPRHTIHKDEKVNRYQQRKEISKLTKRSRETYLRSPSTSGRSFVMAMTSANNVTKVVMKATGELQVEIKISKI